jgi:hypothetical protein
MNKDVLKICHDNTHSTSRIFRNIELIKREDIDWTVIEKRLEAIEKSAIECREQIDKLYLIIKNHE